MERVNAGGYTAEICRCETAVVGTGAAGYNAADCLSRFGHKDILIVSENRLAGTSRNTGSDKQTYYKLTMAGDEPDSVGRMTETLFAGECVDGDLALCEAALSARCFLKLVELGIPFPQNRYGEFVGYKTDHDPACRATSVGPYTSRQMTEKLETAVQEKKIPMRDRLQVIRILTDRGRIEGLLCLNLQSREEKDRFVMIRCRNVIWATGGPAGIYADSVYPHGHYGATGLALEAGALGKNLTEWQYGLASVRPRWNVSGTYMQVLPKMISTEADGSDPREFLMDFFGTEEEMLDRLFLKGYQWPFDVRKVENGSSVIDILVYMEHCRGRRVWLDYRENPCGKDIPFDRLNTEAREYLGKAGACFGTPLERLCRMNLPAVEFYLERGVDLSKEPLEIALCAQHNNGGLDVDRWWQTAVSGLFSAGEAAGTHGVYRPGGTALNAGQVGSLRAAQYIAAHTEGIPEDGFSSAALAALREAGELSEHCLASCGSGPDTENGWNVQTLRKQAAEKMSLCGAAFRNTEAIREYRAEVGEKLASFADIIRAEKLSDLSVVFRTRDMLITQYAYLSAMADYAEQGGGSRGSALYTDPAGKKPYPKLPETFRFKLDAGNFGKKVQLTEYRNGQCSCTFRTVRPVPECDNFFENVWRGYRENGNID